MAGTVCCWPTLYRPAALIVGEREAAEVVQEAIARAMREPDFFERVRSLIQRPGMADDRVSADV